MRSKSALHKRIAFRDRMTPHFGGGALSSRHHAALGTRDGALKLANHSEMSQIDECGCGRPKPKTMLHPPL